MSKKQQTRENAMKKRHIKNDRAKRECNDLFVPPSPKMERIICKYLPKSLWTTL